jgi:hypothetical protein
MRRRITFHVLTDGRIDCVVYWGDQPISRHRFQQGWTYIFGRGNILSRCIREWDGLEWDVLVTFEAL